MATTLQLRRYNTATIASTTGADGEVLVDSTKKTLVVQDGSTAGGTPLATETFVTSGLASLQTTVNAALVNYVLNTNLTSTLTAYPTNTNLTSTLTGYPTNANLTSTVSTAISNLVGGAPAILDTLGEIATALGNNSSLAVTLTSSIALKATSSDLSYLAWTSVVSTLQSSGYTLTLSSNGALIPGSNNMDLGTSSAPFRSLYISNNTFYFGTSAVNIASGQIEIVTGSSTSTLVNTVALNTATSAVQSNITVLLYTQVSSVSSSILYTVSSTYVSVSSLTSSVSFYISSSLTSYVTVSSLSSSVSFYVSSALTSYVTVDTVSSYLTSYVTLDYLSSTLTSLGTVAELNLSSAGLVFYTGDNTTSFTLNQSFSSVSINTDATSILIRYPSQNLVSSIINLTTGSTIFANVSSSSTNVEIPFILSDTPTVSSSYGTIIYQQFGFYQTFGNGSSYAVTSSVNSSYTHTLHLSTNGGGNIWLAENNGWTLSSSSITVTTSVLFVTLIELYETSGSTTSVLIVPVTSSTNIQNSWSGDPVYFDNIDVGYTTSTSSYNGSDPGKLVYTNPNGVQYYEDGTIVYPNGNVESPSNFFINTSSGSTTFEFTTSGSIVLPAGGDIKNSSGNSIICSIPCPTSSVPVTVTSTGTAGQLAYNSSHVYICVATNTWRRANLSTF
jgi:hypothetical protein